MKLMWITWTGPHRLLPGIGEARPKDRLCVPEEKGRSYIEQGLAKEFKVKEAKNVRADD